MGTKKAPKSFNGLIGTVQIQYVFLYLCVYTRVYLSVNPHTRTAPLISMGPYEDQDCHYYWI